MNSPSIATQGLDLPQLLPRTYLIGSLMVLPPRTSNSKVVVQGPGVASVKLTSSSVLLSGSTRPLSGVTARRPPGTSCGQRLCRLCTGSRKRLRHLVKGVVSGTAKGTHVPYNPCGKQHNNHRNMHHRTLYSPCMRRRCCLCSAAAPAPSVALHMAAPQGPGGTSP